MSVNAEVCPHCGENAFYERRDRKVAVDEPCDYGSGSELHVWQRCAGRGYFYAARVVVSEQVAFDEAAAKHLKRLRDGREYWFSDEVLANREAMDAVQRGEYELQPCVQPWERGFGYGCYDLYYGRKTCPKCRGRGKIRVEKIVCHWEDIRKPVE